VADGVWFVGRGDAVDVYCNWCDWVKNHMVGWYLTCYEVCVYVNGCFALKVVVADCLIRHGLLEDMAVGAELEVPITVLVPLAVPFSCQKVLDDTFPGFPGNVFGSLGCRPYQCRLRDRIKCGGDCWPGCAINCVDQHISPGDVSDFGQCGDLQPDPAFVYASKLVSGEFEVGDRFHDCLVVSS
jgi:hypothetical protein